ncbi:MAG: ATP-binding protein [Gemmatimonadetes bacterium]|nr:ATP-binding protein [Gemmatimonadota bacterium]
MKPIFETCTPRPEVLAGDLTEDTFAARLRDVIDGTADAAYQDPGNFFRNTFPTDGLRTLAREVLGRLSGKEPGNSPFIRLETSFGGGKTHNLIALYHLATGGGQAALDAAEENAARSNGGEGIVPDADWLPANPWAVAGVVGSDLDPAEGIAHDGVTTWTLWGELAWQVGASAGGPEGGKRAYAHVRKADETRVAPGTASLERAVGERPTLIMFDEIARYLRAAKAVRAKNGKTDLAEQTVAFLMTLIELAASRPNIAFVLTLADSSDAFRSETVRLQAELEEVKNVSARQERVITPASESEIAPIVRHRLFEGFDDSAAAAAADAYRACYAELAERGVEIPDRLLRADHHEEMLKNYPFHPDLFTVLTLKTATIPQFQKTRGALRLLARMIRGLWESRSPDVWTIAPFHVDLRDEAVLNDLTSRLGRPEFRAVVQADIASGRSGNPAHAEKLDERWVAEGKAPYGRRLATSIFVHSLTQGIATGIEWPDLLAATVQPGDDPELLRQTLARARGEERGAPGEAFWFLHWDGRLYLFKTEPSLEKVVQDELSLVGLVRAKKEVDRRIERVWRPGTFKPVYFPAEASELPDDSGAPKLAVPHFEACAVEAGGARPPPPDLVRKLFAHAGTTETPRTFKNNVVFLVADKKASERMVALVQRHLAIERIVKDRGRMAQFSTDQRTDLRAMGTDAELAVRVAITRTYRHLFYPSADAPKRSDGLAYHGMPVQEQGKVSRDQTGILVGVLRDLDKVLTGDDSPMNARFVKAKAWTSGAGVMSTDDLRREFAKRLGLKMLLDPGQLKKTIRNGCSQGVWVYYDPKRDRPHGKDSPPPFVEISGEAMLYTPEEAGKVFPSEEEKCERCGRSECACGEECPLCGHAECTCDAPDPERLVVTVNAAPGRAFQRIADAFQDAKREFIGTLKITCEDLSDMRALGMAVPQFPKGEYRVDLQLVAEFGERSADGEVKVRYRGLWDRYKRLRSTLEAQAGEATKAGVTIVLTAFYREGLAPGSRAFETLRDVMVQLDMGRIQIRGEERLASDPEPALG